MENQYGLTKTATDGYSQTELLHKYFVYNNIRDDVEEETFEEWLKSAEEWKTQPVLGENNKLIAVVMIRENEIHVSIDQSYRGKWLNRGIIRDIIGRLFYEYGTVKTCTTWGNKEAENFVSRLGFKPNLINWVLEDYKWNRR
jgi:RimJ/RimL family protein N-acetyltransferase